MIKGDVIPLDDLKGSIKEAIATEEHCFPCKVGSCEGVPHDHTNRYAHLKTLLDTLKLDSVLDLGCGSGYGSVLLNAKSYLGIDISKGAIEFANKFIQPFVPNSKFISGSVPTILTSEELVGKKFNIVSLVESIDHLKPVQQKSLISIIPTLVKPGGYCFITCLKRPEFKKQKRSYGKVFGRELSYTELKDIAKALGAIKGTWKQVFNSPDDCWNITSDTNPVNYNEDPDHPFFQIMLVKPK